MGKRILLAEDEKALVLTLTDRLYDEGYEVEAALDGEACLKRATSDVIAGEYGEAHQAYSSENRVLGVLHDSDDGPPHWSFTRAKGSFTSEIEDYPVGIETDKSCARHVEGWKSIGRLHSQPRR